MYEKRRGAFKRIFFEDIRHVVAFFRNFGSCILLYVLVFDIVKGA